MQYRKEIFRGRRWGMPGKPTGNVLETVGITSPLGDFWSENQKRGVLGLGPSRPNNEFRDDFRNTWKMNRKPLHK